MSIITNNIFRGINNIKESGSKRLEKIIDKKVNGVGLNIFERFVHIFANLLSESYKNRFNKLNRLSAKKHNKNVLLFNKLPTEILSEITKKLNPQSLKTLSVVSETANAICKIDDQLEKAKEIQKETKKYHPQIVKTFGGEDAFYNLPQLDLGNKSPHHLQLKDLNAPVMRGRDCYNNRFVSFCIALKSRPHLPRVITLIQNQQDLKHRFPQRLNRHQI